MEKLRSIKWNLALPNPPNSSNKITSRSSPRLISRRWLKLTGKWRKSDLKTQFKIKLMTKAKAQLVVAENQSDFMLRYFI